MVKLVNRAKMTTSTSGTGTITLGSASDGYQSFADAGVSNSDVVRFVIEDGDAWELSSGTYTASGTTLTRTLGESSTGSLLNLSGNAVVFITAAAADIGLTLVKENYSNDTAPNVTGNDSVGIGGSVVVSASDSVAMGYLAKVEGAMSVAIGVQAHVTSGASQAIAIGDNAKVNAGTSGVALGTSFVEATDAFAAVIGTNSSTYGAKSANAIAIGDLAKSTNSNSLALGNTVTSSGPNSAVLGGASSTASGSGATVIGGVSNTADGTNSTAKGYYGDTHGIQGKHATGIYWNNQQGAHYVLGYTTTSATPIALNSAVWTPNATNQVVLPNNSVYAFHGTIVARQKAGDGTACAAWKVEGLIRREGSAGTTVLVNSATTVLDNTPSWGMALSADTTNGCLKIEATGAASTNIRWVASIHTSEVTYA